MAESKLELEQLSGPQKAAVFLLKMGERLATEIFKKLSDDEIKAAASAMADIDRVPAEIGAKVMEEFIVKFNNEEPIDIKGEAFLKSVIGKSLDKDRAKSVYQELEYSKNGMPFAWSRHVDVAALGEKIEGEHPQTIAMILAYLPPEIAAEVLMTLPDEKKGDIAMRIAQLNQIPDEVIREVDHTLHAELSTKGKSGAEAGGLETLVQILNGIDKASEDTIMEIIEEENSEMAGSIREMMFVFEDLASVDDRGMREILKRVESQQLVLAMKTASDEMKEKILGNLSSRASEMLKEDLEVMGPVRLSEVEKAQQDIVRAAKELEAEGTIVLGGKGKEDVLV